MGESRTICIWFLKMSLTRCRRTSDNWSSRTRNVSAEGASGGGCAASLATHELHNVLVWLVPRSSSSDLLSGAKFLLSTCPVVTAVRYSVYCRTRSAKSASSAATPTVRSRRLTTDHYLTYSRSIHRLEPRRERTSEDAPIQNTLSVPCLPWDILLDSEAALRH